MEAVKQYSRPLLAVINSRGLTPEFFNPPYELSDPNLFNNMKAVVERIKSTIKNGEKIVIYGDYDVDGLTASSLLLDLLKRLGGKVEIFIPSRHEYGYGLNTDALNEIKKTKPKLIVTVDCGVTALAEVEHAKKIGLEIIITDHHALPEKLPECLILHPLVNSDYPFTYFSGAGVAFTLARAVIASMAKQSDAEKLEKWLLDLAMLGTISDVVPLVDENRIIAKYGLLVLAKTRRPGLQAILSAGGFANVALANRELMTFASPSAKPLKKVDERTVGWVIAPRLNASGRLKNAIEAINLLVTEDALEAKKLALDLEKMNMERRAITESMLKEARSTIQRMGERNAYIVSSKSFNHGVAGIVAARLSEEFGKPVLICEEMENGHKGSARAPKGYNLIEKLREASSCFLSLGGHAGAAGFTVNPAKLSEVDEHIHNVFELSSVVPVKIDAELEIADITIESAEELKELAPFGFGNEEPLFKVLGSVKYLKPVGADGKHLKFSLSNEKNWVDVIGFGLGDSKITDGDRVEVIGSIDVNEYNGKKSAQIKAVDIRKKN